MGSDVVPVAKEAARTGGRRRPYFVQEHVKLAQEHADVAELRARATQELAEVEKVKAQCVADQEFATRYGLSYQGGGL